MPRQSLAEVILKQEAAISALGQGELTLNPWELTHIDTFPKKEYWRTPANGAAFLPDLCDIHSQEESLTRTWSPVIDELLRIRTLNDDWDGEGTEAPAPALVDGAITLAHCLQAKGIPPASRVIAGVNGTIYFEWHTPLGYQEIEVTSPNDAECRWLRKGSNAAEVVNLSRRS